MTQEPTTPTVYLKQGCPFCFKLRVYLLEAGLLDKVSIREFVAGGADEQEVRAVLEPQLEKVTFPAAEVSPGRFIQDSDALVAHFSDNGGVDPADLPTYQAYLAGPFAALHSLFTENMALKKQLA